MTQKQKELKEVNTFLAEQGMTEKQEPKTEPYFKDIGDFDESEDAVEDDEEVEAEDPNEEETTN